MIKKYPKKDIYIYFQKKCKDNIMNQPSKNFVKINDELHGVHSTDSQFKFKTAILRLCLFDYSDAYLLVIGRITIIAEGADDNPK